MFRLGKPKPITEREAAGEIERCYHEIKQVMRVSGVNLNFRTLAGFERSFPSIWDAMRPAAETRRFEIAADDLRSAGVRLAENLGQLHDVALARLGRSQAHHIRGFLDLYHYTNPKLLLFTSALRLALDGEIAGDEANADAELIERGVPPRMMPMEMVPEDTDDPGTQELFTDIKRTLGLSSINSDYRTLALFPDYLQIVWEHLKPITQRAEYAAASDALREQARSLARTLPRAQAISRERIDKLGDDSGSVAKTVEEFERLLPSLVVNIALVELAWRPGDELVRSPFPAASRSQAPAGRGEER